MNEISFPFSLEIEVKIARYATEHGLTRDEVIANLLSVFLSKQGLRNLSAARFHKPRCLL